MYRVLKPKGHNGNITVENTDTKVQVIIGKLSIPIIEILERNGVRLSEDHLDGTISMRDEWDITVDEESAKELTKKVLTMNKPIREQKKPKKSNKQIDAMDVLLGLAKYN